MQTHQENLNNYSTYSFTTNSQNELVGGRSQEWKKLIENICQKYVEQTPHGDIMGKLAYEIKNIKRTEFPIFLDPKTASFVDVGIHAKIRQYLSDSTIEKTFDTLDSWKDIHAQLTSETLHQKTS